MKRLLTIIVVLAVVGGIGAAGYLGFASARKPEVSREVRAPATVPVTRGDVERAVTAPGQLVNAREMT
ncbi:MAG: hypothetical protein M1546_21505, partial [Chloroflexi bacterium]|nr:hypothetical protein [Chloroflexota bacterium]